jgi:hypothetical protein
MLLLQDGSWDAPWLLTSLPCVVSAPGFARSVDDRVAPQTTIVD